jgi:hypothetical protein
MHRLIMSPPADMNVDHRDCDGINNRRSNLRICTDQENSRNRRTRKDSRTRIKGVTWNKFHQKFAAHICTGGGKQKHLGYFSTAEAAADAYRNAANANFGEFARVA